MALTVKCIVREHNNMNPAFVVLKPRPQGPEFIMVNIWPLLLRQAVKHRQNDRQADGQTDNETQKQTDRQTDRQRDRQTD